MTEYLGKLTTVFFCKFSDFFCNLVVFNPIPKIVKKYVNKTVTFNKITVFWTLQITVKSCKIRFLKCTLP